MNIRQLAPWNWFKDEEQSEARSVPVGRAGPRNNQPYYTPLSQLHQEIDRMFDRVFSSFSLLSTDWDTRLSQQQNMLLRPNVDITASDKEYTITVEVPGVDEDDVQLELANNALTIKGEKRQESKEENKDYYRIERSYGSFQRVLSLPEDADQDAIDAQFKNGVLTVRLPRKAVAKPKGKVIDIKKAA